MMSVKTEQLYETQDGLRTLQRAEEIKKNRPLMGRIKKEVNLQQKMLSKVKTLTNKKRKKR